MSRFAFVAPNLGVLLVSARRFPISALCAVCFAGVMIGQTHSGTFLDSTTLAALSYALFAGFMASLAVALVAEGKGWPFLKALFASALVFVGIALWMFVVGIKLGLPQTLLGFALLGACVLAPLAQGHSNEALWSFNQRSFTGFGLAALAVGIFQIGLGAIFFALSHLFDAGDSKWYADASIIILSVFWPLYTLTFVPHLPLSVEDKTPRIVTPLAFVLSYVALPVLLVYGAVIAVYGLDVLALGHQPKGSVGWMVMGFAAAGILLHFLLYPLRESGSLLVRLYNRYFLLILLPYLALLFWAVGVRVADYGLTEHRILALLGGVWALGVALIGLKTTRLALAPAALSLLLCVASLAVEPISFSNQFVRLQETIAHFNLPLQNGEVDPAKKITLTWQERKDLSGLLDYFDDRRDGRVLPLTYLPGKNAEEIMKAWGLGYVNSWERREGSETQRLSFSSHILVNDNDPALVVTGYDQLWRFNASTGIRTAPPASDTTKTIRTYLEGTTLVVEETRTQAQARIALPDLFKQPLDTLDSEVTDDAPLTAEVTLGSERVRVVIERLTLQQSHNGVWGANYATGYLLVSLPD